MVSKAPWFLSCFVQSGMAPVKGQTAMDRMIRAVVELKSSKRGG